MWGKKKKVLTKGEDDKKSKYEEKDKICSNLSLGQTGLGRCSDET